MTKNIDIKKLDVAMGFENQSEEGMDWYSVDDKPFVLDGTTLYGSDPSECTVDGCHATDLGFYKIAQNMAPVIENILTIRK